MPIRRYQINGLSSTHITTSSGLIAQLVEVRVQIPVQAFFLAAALVALNNCEEHAHSFLVKENTGMKQVDKDPICTVKR